MKWIVAAMVLFIIPYTFLTLRYRKPESFQPYEDARERAHIAKAGYSRISLSASQPADGRTEDRFGIAPSAGGIPADLSASLIDRPVLPEAVGAVAAAPACLGGANYPIRFDCTPPAGQLELSVAHLYHKGQDLFILVGFAPVADGLVQRRPADTIQLEVPSAELEPGTYQVTLVGSRASKTWAVQVH
jgi:hypothetical protein